MISLTSFAKNGHVLLTRLFCIGMTCTTTALAAPTPLDALDAQQQLQNQQRQRQLREQLEQSPDARLPQPAADNAKALLPPDEQPCFTIERIELTGDAAARFQWARAAADAHNDVATGRCLGTQGIALVMRRIQNALMARGYITTRILAAEQDLSVGTLKLIVIPGRIRAIEVDNGTGRRIIPHNLIAAQPGDILNLRDIEQGIENLRRSPSAQADIEITPADNAGESDLIIHWQQSNPLRLTLSLDDGGSKSTGRYQGSLSLAIDSPLQLGDQLYVGASHSFSGLTTQADRATGGYNLYYAIPFGYWLISTSASSNDYHQTIAGNVEDYVYSGTSKNSDIRLAWLFYRDATRKSTVTLRGWHQENRNYIDDTEVEIQRRRTSGWELAFSHQQYIGQATVNANLTWHHGTGFDAQAAPEEAFNEGTARPRILMASLQYNQPFQLAGQRLRLSNEIRAQWNHTRLVAQDRFSIGSRYTVRGYSGELTLAGDRGWLVRNDLAWSPGQSTHEIYLGLDYGRVDGPSTQWLPGKQLAGGAFGLRGQLFRLLNYDLFTGWPIIKPAGFAADGMVFGFNVSLTY